MRLLVCLLILSIPAYAGERIRRDPKAVRIFRAVAPCPATGKPEKRCPGYIIDHIIPLCAGGPDEPSNMQWQTVEAAKIKDQAEREQCRRLPQINRLKIEPVDSTGLKSGRLLYLAKTYY